MKRLDGKVVAQQYGEAIRKAVAKEQENGKSCGLALIRCGDDPGVGYYAKAMEKVARSFGIPVHVHTFPVTVTEEELLDCVEMLNRDPQISGILPLLPWACSVEVEPILNHIVPSKDIDGLTDANIARVVTEKGGFAPCTARAVMAILDYYGITLQGRHVVILGRSHVVGRPLVQLCLQQHATVTVCHSKTKNLADYTRQADILICAIGQAEYVTGAMVKEGAIVLDVGTNRKEGRMVGDVEASSVVDKVAAYTPVPGGVGAVTTTMVLQGLIKK